MNIFQKLLGINWKTTLTGISSLIAAVGVIGVAWRTKDFATIFTQLQTLGPIVALILLGIQGLSAKDSNVTGAGERAKSVASDGTLSNAQGEVVGKQ